MNGTKTGGTYSQTVMGIESFTLTDTGNLGTGGYARTIEGDGFYERTSTGDGATQPSDTGAIDYLFSQSADPHSGTFDASWTGTTRYDLLENFHDISNTQPGRSPGHMNFYPFGQPFVDPVVVLVPSAITVGEAILLGTGSALAAILGYQVGTHLARTSGTGLLATNAGNIRRIGDDLIRAMGGEEVVREIKEAVLGGGAGARNPDLYYDPRTGEIYIPIEGGGFTPTGMNIDDFLALQERRSRLRPYAGGLPLGG